MKELSLESLGAALVLFGIAGSRRIARSANGGPILKMSLLWGPEMAKTA
jgi:hypothetical protein